MTDTASAIVTPEAVVLDFRTAGVGSRCVAKLLDISVQAMVLLLVAWVVIAVASAAGAAAEWVVGVTFAAATFAVLFGYPVLLEVLWSGKTLGKAAMGVRVVTREGAPVKFRHAATRSVIGLVEILLLPFIAVLTCALSRNDQRVGDLAGGTIVIRERTAVDHAVALRFVVPPGYEAYAGSLDVSGLDERHYEVVRSFLTRVLTLSPDARAALALRLANPVAVAIDHEPPAVVSPEVFLACVAVAYQRRHGATDPAWDPAAAWSTGGWGPPTGWAPAGAPGWGPAPGGATAPGWAPAAADWRPPPPAGWPAAPPGPAPAPDVGASWSPPAPPGSAPPPADPPR